MWKSIDLSYFCCKWKRSCYSCCYCGIPRLYINFLLSLMTHLPLLISQHIVQPLKIRNKNTKMSISHRNASSCCHTFWKYFPFSKVKANFWSFPKKFVLSQQARETCIFSKCDLTYRRTHLEKITNRQPLASRISQHVCC